MIARPIGRRRFLLGGLGLTGALALTAQTPPPNSLPWKSSGALPWQTDDPNAGVSHLLLQVQDGKHKIIAPDVYAEVKIKPAPWF